MLCKNYGTVYKLFQCMCEQQHSVFMNPIQELHQNTQNKMY